MSDSHEHQKNNRILIEMSMKWYCMDGTMDLNAIE